MTLIKYERITRHAADPLGEHLEQQKEWSEVTFGPGQRTLGILAHIRKELAEIEASPHDLEEWIDVIQLALDGYWRHGGDPLHIMLDLQAKLAKNKARKWPAILPEDEPTEHIEE